MSEGLGGSEPSGDPPSPPGTTLAPRRLHPAAAVLATLDNVRDALISIVVLVVIGSQSGRLGTIVVAVGAISAAVAVAVAIARWRAEVYSISGGAIHHRRGVISPDETVVPLTRVHSIDVSQGPIQRLFGVDELHVQTAGGGERGEIVLTALAPAETARLRAAAGLATAPGEDEPAAWKISGAALLLVGLTAPQLGALLPIVGGAFALADNLLGDAARSGLVDRLPSETAGILLLAAAALVAAWLLAFLGALVAFAGFSVARSGDSLRITRGFLKRRTTSVPLRRIHALTIHEGPLRRPFGLCSVRLETAGYGREPKAARTLFPLLPTAELDPLLAKLVPALAPPSIAAGAQPLERPPRRALRRFILPGVLAGLVAAGVITAFWSSAWPAIPLLCAAAALHGLIRFRAAGWRLAGDRLLLRRGGLTRRTVLARAAGLQDHSLAQSPLQRRGRLADLSITVASGTSATVPHLDEEGAGALFERLRPGRSAASARSGCA